ncbi:MAG: hypothetical protein EKK37_17350 [Sphingobacteriales bacterium]|nr:MAG: hypothetical protein EKK37_17350 [Sphingobacteriales bacterium]
MAIQGKANVLEMVRMMKAPYWRIYETRDKAQNGQPIATANEEHENMGIDDSVNMLTTTLNRLTAGQYVFKAYEKPADKRARVDSMIEIESGRDVSISGTGNAVSFAIEGFGNVTPANFEQAIEFKHQKLQEKLKEEERIKKLEEENKNLKKQVNEYESGYNNGIRGIGAVVWSVMRNTPAGKEIMGMAGHFMKQARNNAAASPGAQPKKEEGEFTDAVVVDEAMSAEAHKRMEAALESLAEDNEELIQQLEALAKMKKEDPEMFQQAVGMLQ